MDRFVEAGGNFIDTADTYWVRFRILESIFWILDSYLEWRL